MARPSRFLAAALAIAGAVLALLAGASIAGSDTRPAASRFAVDSPAVRAAQGIARAHWGADPCGGEIRVTWTPQARDINAISTWSTRGADPYGDPAANGDCAIRLNTRSDFAWPKLCTVIVHEYGHLAGHDHDPRAGALMSSIYSTPVAACTAAGVRARAARSTTS